MEAARLRAQVVAMEKAHADKVNILHHDNATLEREKSTFNDKIMKLQSSFFAKDVKAKELAATAAIAKSQNDSLDDQVNILEGTCSELRGQMRVMLDKLAKLEVDLIEMALHLEEKFYPHLLIVIAGRKWLLTHDLKLFITKCLNSTEYLVALGAAISRATEKGMQVGLEAGIEHGKQGRRLEELVAYNPSAEEDYNTALRELRAVEFSLLADLKSNKDASIEAVMNLLRLSDPLANLHEMSGLQPDNIAKHRSALAGVFSPLAEPFSVQSLTGAANTSDVMPSAAVTTISLSTTFASASTILPVSMDDYVVADAVDEENVQPNVERSQYKGEGSAAADINFKEEELDTTP
ncbi:hypothetical protein Tco_0580476 [Tanacetum coccineum]